jgi:hypothetical protein
MKPRDNELIDIDMKDQKTDFPTLPFAGNYAMEREIQGGNLEVLQ